MRPIRPGKYRHIVYIQKKESVRTPDGHWVEDWVDYKKKFVDKKPLKSEDYFKAKASNAVSTVVWKARYDDTIKGDMRVVEKNKDGTVKQVYDIVGDPLDMEGLHREMEIITEAVVSS
ncbi:phage head closure protein [Virgibacillus halodenitrificans]|uniref:phage head closure protein n=1 Tax=Virgibacillus halodenitrificans TaxID=1482 RepID=UPI001EEDB76B|nr:phage head closure protein [Virgibacillus halodenitrificans]MCG1029309.1 phage head closure protein [Virgibacillus halodenitrificans]